MDLVEAFIQDHLDHAAPKYYDPVKAHEYYERTKELKGREPSQSESDLRTQGKKKAWGYSKVAIAEAKKQELERAALTNRAAFDKIRGTAKQLQEAIREKLNALLEKTSEDVEDKAKAAETKIRRLPPIPKGLSPSAAAAAHRKRAEEIARIRGEIDKSREAAGSASKSARDSSRAELEKVRSEMRTTVDTARKSYEALRENLKAKYEKESQQEFEAIKQNV